VSVRFSATLPYEDYLAANWLLIRRRWLWRGVARYMLVLTPIMFLIPTLSEFTVDGLNGSALVINFVTGVMFAAGALGITFLWWLWCVPRSARRTYAEMQIEGLETSFEFDTDGIRIANALGTSNLKWEHLTNWAESERLMLLSRTQLMFYAIPKDQVDPAQISALRSALERQGVPRR
jgi:hypothetical protein